MGGDFGKINQTIFDYWFNRSSEEENSSSDDIEDTPFLLQDLNDKSLKKLENLLSKVLTGPQTEKAISILRGLGESASPKEEEDTKVSFGAVFPRYLYLNWKTIISILL